MEYDNERWIKLFTRDTAAWLDLPWQARGLHLEIARKLDARGELSLGRRGLPAVASAVRAPWGEIEPFVLELIADGRLAYDEARQVLLDPDFEARQSARASPAERKRRERARKGQDDAVTSRDVTRGHAESRAVTNVTRDVTPSHDQIRSDQKRSEETRSPLPPEGAEAEPTTGVFPRAVGPDGENGALFGAWAEGVREVAKVPQARLSRLDAQTLVEIANVHGAGRTGQALLDWMRETAAAFARQHDPAFGGFTPAGLAKWLNANRPARASPRRALVQAHEANPLWKPGKEL